VIRVGERVYVWFCGLGQVVAMTKGGPMDGWCSVYLDAGGGRGRFRTIHSKKLKAVTIEKPESEPAGVSRPFIPPHGPPVAGDAIWNVQKNTVENMNALVEWANAEVDAAIRRIAT